MILRQLADECSGESSRRNRFSSTLAVILFLLPQLYVASYFALVEPQRPVAKLRSGGEVIWWSTPAPSYRRGGEQAERFFWPLEMLDRRVRPRMWRPIY